MICKVCNAENKPNAAFCENCGATLEQETVVTKSCNSDVPATDPGKTLSLVSLILGIAAIVFGTICSCVFSCLGGLIPMVLGVVAIILGILGMNKSKAAGFNNKQGMVGMILGIATIVIVVIFIIVNAVAGGIMGAVGSANTYNSPYSYSYYG